MLDPFEAPDAARVATEAASLEQQAIDKDRSGDVTAALSLYNQAASKLSVAAAQLPVDHGDTKAILNHRLEVLRRIDYLQSLFPGQTPQVPIESHIQPVQLSLGSSGSKPSTPEGKGTGNKTLATAAAIGGLGGLVLLGPISAVAGAVGFAYCSTQKGALGSTVRVVADGSAAAVTKANDFDNQHGITTKARKISVAAFQRTKEFDDKYQVTATVKTGVVAAANSIVEVNKKYSITDKAGKAISRGLSSIADLLSGPTLSSTQPTINK